MKYHQTDKLYRYDIHVQADISWKFGDNGIYITVMLFITRCFIDFHITTYEADGKVFRVVADF